jgi:hypothetical protein
MLFNAMHKPCHRGEFDVNHIISASCEDGSEECGCVSIENLQNIAV